MYNCITEDAFPVVKDIDTGVKHRVVHSSVAGAYYMRRPHALAVALLPVGNPVDRVQP